MEKSVQVYISVDNVPLSDIEALQEALEKVFEEYEYKRIQLTIQDEKLVQQPTR